MSRNERREKLEQLRASKSAKGRVAATSSDGDLYDLVPQEVYESVVRSRLAEDDFIVDDNGEGYVDNGMDDWDRPNEDDESDEETGALPRTSLQLT